jgi:hypothetical protein
MQADDSLRVSNACEMVQISTYLSVLSPSMATTSENGVAGRGREQIIDGKIFAMEGK